MKVRRSEQKVLCQRGIIGRGLLCANQTTKRIRLDVPQSGPISKNPAKTAAFPPDFAKITCSCGKPAHCPSAKAALEQTGLRTASANGRGVSKIFI